MHQSSANTTKSSVVVMVVEDEEVIRTLAAEFMTDIRIGDRNAKITPSCSVQDSAGGELAPSVWTYCLE